jgi:hypothetical protein
VATFYGIINIETFKAVLRSSALYALEKNSEYKEAEAWHNGRRGNK